MAFRNIGTSLELIKLRATDYLGKFTIWHHQCHEQQRKRDTEDTRCLVDGHAYSICYSALLRRDGTHYGTHDGRNQ